MKPLRLKAEVAKREYVKGVQSDCVAKVQVDTGVYHLDQPYDYSVPTGMLSQVKTGIRVQVPFGGREVEGLILSVIEGSEIGGLKPLTKILSPISVASAESFNLMAAVARRKDGRSNFRLPINRKSVVNSYSYLRMEILLRLSPA
jgi:primosomal protein N' (replication factor Y)